MRLIDGGPVGPPSLMRSILLAAVMEAEATDHEFWANYRSEAPLLKGPPGSRPVHGGRNHAYRGFKAWRGS